MTHCPAPYCDRTYYGDGMAGQEQYLQINWSSNLTPQAASNMLACIISYPSLAPQLFQSTCCEEDLTVRPMFRRSEDQSGRERIVTKWNGFQLTGDAQHCSAGRHHLSGQGEAAGHSPSWGSCATGTHCTHDCYGWGYAPQNTGSRDQHPVKHDAELPAYKRLTLLAFKLLHVMLSLCYGYCSHSLVITMHKQVLHCRCHFTSWYCQRHDNNNNNNIYAFQLKMS